jgi:release factor glutamine methyltransferase
VHNIFTLGDIYREFVNRLTLIYPAEEAISISNLVFEEKLKLKKTDIVLNKSMSIQPADQVLLGEILAELEKHRPVQYVLGKIYFLDCIIFVNESVLIPRPETEEMVLLFLKEQDHKNIKIIDICTGSGCIAISIKHHIPEVKLTAVDNSNEALEIARKNAETNQAGIEFLQMDFLNKEKRDELPEYDVIISNPPYVRKSEKSVMHPNILAYEPEDALFVEDEDPLIFYKAIADFSNKHIRHNGSVWLELNENLAKETEQLFLINGWKTILKKDMRGKYRFLIANK